MTNMTREEQAIFAVAAKAAQAAALWAIAHNAALEAGHWAAWEEKQIRRAREYRAYLDRLGYNPQTGIPVKGASLPVYGTTKMLDWPR
jgi:hypothetical protein